MLKRLIVAVTAAAIVLPAVPATATTTDAPLNLPAMGVQFHGTWGDYTNAQRIEVLDKMAAAGVTWVRIDLGWVSFQEQGPGSYSQWYVDRVSFLVDAARERGIKVLGTFWLTPEWANGGQDGEVPPTNPADYARAAAWVAERFKGRIDAWEIWNEPNHDSFWEGTVADYVTLLKAAYPAIKQADPDAEVVLGGPSYNDTTWLRKVYEAGAADYFDVMATHPYQGIADAPPETPDDGSIWLLSHVKAVHDLMRSFGDGDKEIWFTEFGWSSHENWPDIKNWDRGVSLQQQGDYLIRTLKLVGERYPYVTNVFWYNERNRDSGNIRNDNYGLLYRDLSPKPAYLMLKAFLVGDGTTSPVAPVTPSPTPEPTAEPTTTPSPTASPSPTENKATDPLVAPSPSPSSTPTVSVSSPPCSDIKIKKKRRVCRRRVVQAALAGMALTGRG